MSAIRRDEDTDNIHSIYVDQWDWEKIISERGPQRGVSQRDRPQGLQGPEERLKNTWPSAMITSKRFFRRKSSSSPPRSWRISTRTKTPEGARGYHCPGKGRCLPHGDRRQAGKRRAPRRPCAGLRRLALKRRYHRVVSGSGPLPWSCPPWVSAWTRIPLPAS